MSRKNSIYRLPSIILIIAVMAIIAPFTRANPIKKTEETSSADTTVNTAVDTPVPGAILPTTPVLERNILAPEVAKWVTDPGADGAKNPLDSLTDEDIKNPFIQVALSWSGTQAPTFTIPSEKDFTDAMNQLQHSSKVLDYVLKENASTAAGWKRYLNWDALETELKKGTNADLLVLNELQKKISSGAYGLELECFQSLRHSLVHYTALKAAATDKKAPAEFSKVSRMITALLISCSKNYANSLTLWQRPLDECLTWMRYTGQAPEQIQKTDSIWAQMNLYIHVPASTLLRRGEMEMEEDVQINDYILEAHVTGKGIYKGISKIELIPNEEKAEFAIRSEGTVNAKTRADAGQAIIYSTSTTQLTADKHIFFGPDGFTSASATGSATTKSQLVSIDTGGRQVIYNAAMRRSTEQRPQADAISASRAIKRTILRMNQQVNQALSNIQNQFNDIKNSLDARNLFPMLTTRTSDEGLHINGNVRAYHTLGAAVPPPEMSDDGKKCDVQLRIHESLGANFSLGYLNSTRFNEATRNLIIKALPEWMRSTVKNSQNNKAQEDDWSVTFTREIPLDISFQNGKIHFTAHLAGFSEKKNNYPKINISGSFKLEKVGNVYWLVRDGDMEILPPGFNPEKGKLTTREVSLRRILARRLKEAIPERTKLEDILLDAPNTTPGIKAEKMVISPVSVEIKGGWLLLGYNISRAEINESIKK